MATWTPFTRLNVGDVFEDTWWNTFVKENAQYLYDLPAVLAGTPLVPVAMDFNTFHTGATMTISTAGVWLVTGMLQLESKPDPGGAGNNDAMEVALRQDGVNLHTPARTVQGGRSMLTLFHHVTVTTSSTITLVARNLSNPQGTIRKAELMAFRTAA